MTMNSLVDKLVSVSQKPRTMRFKVLAVAFGGLAFFGLVPALLFLVGYFLDKQYLAPNWRSVQMGISLVTMIGGAAIAGWAVLTQVLVGRGTPVPLAPPGRLIVTGPYRFCRNPMMLGATIYYFGVGAWFGSVIIGVLMFLLMFVVGSCYHKFVEERELERRFGQEYADYRKKTPFVIPKMPE
jgi:protein-S-isoprenylcysteine O-methyltransferase Ste14